MLQHCKQLDADRPPRTREQDTKQFSADFCLAYSRVSNAPRKSTKTNKTYKLDPTEDKEGITVYNQSSKQGVTTDENGDFKIEVAEYDVLEFGALQFKDFTIKIDKRIIESRQVSVRLVEDVNKLDEVIVLPYDLSGNLSVDSEAVRTYNVNMSEIYKGEEDFDDYKFSADNKTKIDDPLLDGNRLRNGLNLVNVFRLFVKKKDKSKSEAEKFKDGISPIEKRYTAKFLKENFKIPTDLAEAFVDFIERQSYDKELLDKKK